MGITHRIRLSVIVGLFALLLSGMLSTVQAAAPSIAPASATVPFGQTSVTVTFDTGDGSPGSVFFQYNNTGERLLAQGASGSIQAAFIGQSGRYTFTLYKGIYTTSPAAQGVPVAAQTIQTKVNPDGGQYPDIVAVRPAPDGSAPQPLGSNGGYGNLMEGRQIITGNPSFPLPLTSPPGFSATATYPLTVYIAFDAGNLPSGAPRPAADVYITPPHGSPTLFAEGPYGLIKAAFIVDGEYVLTLKDPTTGEELRTGQLGTARNVVTDKPSYTGGTAAAVQFSFGSDTGGPTLVCVSNGGTGAGAQFANYGSIVALNNGGGGYGTLTGLNTNATPYMLAIYTVSFSSGPQFIQSVTAMGQNCGGGSGPSAMPPALSNGTSATPTLTPVQYTVNGGNVSTPIVINP